MPTVSAQHRPYELCFMLVSILIGVGYLTTVPAPTSVVALMPTWVVGVWSTTLVVSGVLVIVGCLWHGQFVVGLGLERAGLSAQTGALLIIDGSVLYTWTTGHLATFPLLGVGFLTGWMAANIWRIRQIATTLRHLHIPSIGNAP